MEDEFRSAHASILAGAIQRGAGWWWRSEEHLPPLLKDAVVCCINLQICRQTTQHCGCVSAWVVLGGTGIMETVTWGRWDCVGGFLCTDVSPSVPARGLWQCLRVLTNKYQCGWQYPWLCWDMTRVLAWCGKGPGFLDPYIEHCLRAVLLIVNQNYWDQPFCSVREPTIQFLPWEK